jgi:hypothetical protein
MTRSRILLEEILDSLVVEESQPTYAALCRWSDRYPEHREALADFFAAWAVQAELPQEIEVDEDRLANLAVSHALDIVHRHEEEGRRTATPVRARLRLLAAARAAGFSEEELARRSGLDDTLIAKLDLRRLVGVPRLCFERLAMALHVVVDQVTAMVTGPPLAAAGVRHKSKRRPSPVTEDFVDAVRNSTLPDKAKESWLRAVAAERESHGE